jgi:hypothetical protein
VTSWLRIGSMIGGGDGIETGPRDEEEWNQG